MGSAGMRMAGRSIQCFLQTSIVSMLLIAKISSLQGTHYRVSQSSAKPDML